MALISFLLAISKTNFKKIEDDDDNDDDDDDDDVVVDDDDDDVDEDDDDGLPMVGDLLVVAGGHKETLPLS